MKKNNRCKIVSLRNIIIFVLLLFSTLFPLSVYAEQKEIVISFKDANANSCEIADVVIHPGETITLPEAPAERDTTNTIYGVPSWKPVLKGCGRYLKSSDILTYDQVSALSESYGTENGLILYGTRALSLAYYNNDGSKKLWQLYYYEGANATLRDTPYAPNKAYKGWTTDKNGTSVALQFKQKVKLYEDLNVYLVTYARVRYFNTDGSKLYNAGYYKRGTKIVTPTVPARAKSRALGWSNQKNGSKVYAAAGTEQTISKNLDFYAVYKYLPFTVNFTSNNGKSTDKVFKDLTQWAASGEYITLPKVPTKANYIGLGWSDKVNDSKVRVKSGDKVKISKNITYYAIYRQAKTLTMTFVDQDGSTSGSFSALKKTVKEGTAFTLPALPKKNDYDPVSWKLNLNGNVREYSPGEKLIIYGNYRFYACYNRIKVKITFRYDSGKVYKVFTLMKGNSFTFPSMENTADYCFMGWSTVPKITISPSRPFSSYFLPGTQKSADASIVYYPVRLKKSEETDPIRDKLCGDASPDVSAYKTIIFVGDSRTDRMAKTLEVQKVPYRDKNVKFVCKPGTSLAWLKSTGYPEVLEIIKHSNQNDKRPIAVIFNHGVNGLDSYSAYVNYYKEIMPTLKNKNCRLFIMSVNPINSVMIDRYNCKHREEAAVLTFNDYIKKNLQGYTYIDMFGWLMKTGFTTDGGTNGYDINKDDGLHYSSVTYKRIYLRCLQILAGK